jgi:hypothetical protein
MFIMIGKKFFLQQNYYGLKIKCSKDVALTIKNWALHDF